MLKLDDSLVVGIGRHRKCFRHPGNPDLCVKVVFMGDETETLREQKYYQRLRQLGIDWSAVPEFHGNIPTNLGEGAVFTLVRDFDGSVSRSLEYYMDDSSGESLIQRNLYPVLVELKQFLLRHCIVTMTLKPKNVLYQKRDLQLGQLVIVDGLGCPAVKAPLLGIKMLTRRKILRRWEKFEELIGVKLNGVRVKIQ